MPVFQTLLEAQTAFDNLEVQYTAEVAAKVQVETQLVAEQQTVLGVETQIAQAKQEKVDTDTLLAEERQKRIDAETGLANALAQITHLKSVNGIIEAINALSKIKKREFPSRVRTTKDGIQAYVAFLYGNNGANQATNEAAPATGNPTTNPGEVNDTIKPIT